MNTKSKSSELSFTDINQLWVAGLVYLRSLQEARYLAAILNAYLRCCMGWVWSHTIDARLTIKALEMVLMRREMASGLVRQQIQISMSRRTNPIDYSQAERFRQTLKEEVYLSDAHASLKRFLEEQRNQKRLPSAPGYLSPAEFEQSLYQRSYP